MLRIVWKNNLRTPPRISYKSWQLRTSFWRVFHIWMAPRGWELLGDFFVHKFFDVFEKPVTFRKLNIFWYFFKEIYLRELKTTNPGLPVTFRHPRERYRPKKWPSKILNFQNLNIFVKSENRNFKNGAENLQKTSEMKFLDHVDVEQQSCRPECNQSSRKSNPDRKFMNFL